MSHEFYAHSLDSRPPEEWHQLEEHLKGTAELAKSFADAFGCGEWGYLAGLLHVLRSRLVGDLGKYLR